MKKYLYFFIGYITALATIFMASCTISPLEAGSSECGDSQFNPCWVKIAEWLEDMYMCLRQKSNHNLRLGTAKTLKKEEKNYSKTHLLNW